MSRNLRMIFIKYNSLKSDTFFSLILIPWFSRSLFFRFRFSGFSFFSVQVFQSPDFSRSRFFRDRSRILTSLGKHCDMIGMQNHASMFSLILLIRSHIITIIIVECVSVCRLFVFHSTYKILLVINFNVKLKGIAYMRESNCNFLVL